VSITSAKISAQKVAPAPRYVLSLQSKEKARNIKQNHYGIKSNLKQTPQRTQVPPHTTLKGVLAAHSRYGPYGTFVTQHPFYATDGGNRQE
jgi:hypothetical protein